MYFISTSISITAPFTIGNTVIYASKSNQIRKQIPGITEPLKERSSLRFCSFRITTLDTKFCISQCSPETQIQQERHRQTQTDRQNHIHTYTQRERTGSHDCKVVGFRGLVSPKFIVQASRLETQGRCCSFEANCLSFSRKPQFSLLRL